mmetsp:Transcript_3277/g.4408  ORF Transcript_3277/g.4408 Transcript_3277/m.4408 type:complete len:136 (+) Transcript_3277:762-1169(+)
MFADPNAERSDGKAADAWVYFVCIGFAVFGALWVLANDELMRVTPTFFNLFAQSIIGYLYTVVLLYILAPSKYELFSLSKEWGGLGFLHNDQAVATLLLYGPSHGFFGSAGYLICLLYFSPVVVSAAFLVEPSIG